MKKEHKNSILPIFIVLLCILAIVFYYTVKESFQDKTPRTINSAVRIDNTCSDPSQTNIFDRFNFVQPLGKDEDGNDTDCDMYLNYIRYSEFPFNTKNVCLPKCDPTKGWYEYFQDRTYCVRSNCINTLDLSGQIKASWTNVCGPIAKQHFTLTSTLQSISTVSQTFNNQFRNVQSNYVTLYSDMYTFNCTTNPTYCAIRDTRFPALTNNYNTLNSLRANIDLNMTQLSNKMAPFQRIHDSFGCDLFFN